MFLSAKGGEKMAKKESPGFDKGTIDTKKISEVHSQIKQIVESYNELKTEVEKITAKVRADWVGAGRNEFETQYDFLISKIGDFGEVLVDVYDALVDADAAYQTGDDKLRQKFVMSMQS